MMEVTHHPLKGATWMLSAGLAFALINTLTQVLSIHMGMNSTSVAFIQYAIALIVFIPWVYKTGIKATLSTSYPSLHVLRVVLAVVGIQLWIWALAYPIPIWQGIALLMTSPLMATLGAGLFLKEQVGLYRWLATLVGFCGAMLILEPWSESFNWAALLPLGAAFFWASYSLMVKRLSRDDTSSTMVMYLLLLMTPFNALLTFSDFTQPASLNTWLFLVCIGLLTAFAQWAIARAYAVADAAFVQPWDHLKLPVNVLAGYLVFGWMPPGRLWLGAAMIILAVAFITHWENREQQVAVKV
ncbi:DMT family transporter [Spartinivicinus poritis]|uniref:DMT family transporter n=1 Tax=Spartinivicinus poritis TaxID=2994640 RepID=A0ABT5U395_9GAMM|nr:DMT family transporter [Spartinivicinus sp. A2-2]MDE1460834.1 DMT family transporter [Spartinivicinus sp. A2-2]